MVPVIANAALDELIQFYSKRLHLKVYHIWHLHTPDDIL